MMHLLGTRNISTCLLLVTYLLFLSQASSWMALMYLPIWMLDLSLVPWQHRQQSCRLQIRNSLLMLMMLPDAGSSSNRVHKPSEKKRRDNDSLQSSSRLWHPLQVRIASVCSLQLQVCVGWTNSHGIITLHYSLFFFRHDVATFLSDDGSRCHVRRGQCHCLRCVCLSSRDGTTDDSTTLQALENVEYVVICCLMDVWTYYLCDGRSCFYCIHALTNTLALDCVMH